MLPSMAACIAPPQHKVHHNKNTSPDQRTISGIYFRDVLDIVEPKRYQRRGWQLLHMARLTRKINCQARQLQNVFPEHIVGQIEEHNAQFAIRIKDFIDIRQRKPPKHSPNHAKRWLPQAVARACFGRGYVAHKPRLNGRMWKHRRNATATSTRGTADFFAASTTHIQRLRDAVHQFWN